MTGAASELCTSDYPSAWRTPDSRLQRLPGCQSYHRYGRDVPSYEELLGIRDRLLARRPKPTFILCHFSDQCIDLATLSRALDRSPNLCVDIPARQYEIPARRRNS